ncbi:MAG: DNA topoisomerase I [Cyanobacteria bacterium P01_F01_bin.42]
MDFIDKLLDAIENMTRKLMDLLSGSEIEPEYEPIPVPVRDRRYR